MTFLNIKDNNKKDNLYCIFLFINKLDNYNTKDFG